jgi:aspartokinase/homoserine dehydrogenase 1
MKPMLGAGLPVITTLNDLKNSGDKMLKIEGVLSGTLSYIFNSFKAGVKFSQAVKEAKQKGFTEPDPRDDLNGMDVARKNTHFIQGGWRGAQSGGCGN